MNILTDARQMRRVRILFMITYMVSYMTRINYGAVVLEMVHDTGISGSLLSLALTGSFITYGAGQLVSGFFGDRIQPKKLVLTGLCVTVAMNLLIPLCPNYLCMTAVWCVNGLAQSFMWPPLVRLMVNFFEGQEYNKTTVVVSWGSSFGTILIYLLSPLWIAAAGWRSVFVFSAVCGIVMAFVWKRACPEIASEKIEASGVCSQAKEEGKAAVAKANAGAAKTAAAQKPIFTSPMIWMVMLAIVLQGALRDGVTTWMPTYIQQTYDLGNEISILTGVMLPIFSIGCFQLANKIYEKMPNNPLLCAGIIFGAGAVSGLLLLVFAGSNPALAVLFMALLTGAMHGANLMLVCMVPAFFKKSGNVSAMSGVINSCTYVGSALSTYGIAVISETAGWTVTIGVWALIAIAGTVICLGCVPAWKKIF